MLDLCFLSLLGLGTAGVGLGLLRRLGQTPEHPADALALAVPLGLGLLALVELGLGEVGLLTPKVLATVSVTGLVLGVRELVRWRAEAADRLLRTNSEWYPPGERSLFEWFLLATFIATLLGTLLTALAPVTDGDALCYHLQVPKVFLAQRGVGFDPDLHETVYPLLTELLYAVALAARGPVACRLVQWLLGLVFAANVAALARPSLPGRAWWAGAIALLVPAVSNGMSAPLNDVALAAFGTAALFAWTRSRDRPSLASAALAGVFAGLAMGVKYPALVLTGLLGFSGFFWRGGSGVRRAFRGIAVFGLAALIVGGSWYLRAFIHTGNPVFPFFRHVFGGSGLDEVLDPIKRPMSVTPWNLLTALGPLTLQPDRFDSFSHQFGPVFLLFLPALLLERAPRRVIGLAALGEIFLMLCLTQRQSMRFVLIAVGPMAVGVASLASTWRDRRTLPARLLLAMLILTLLFESGLAVARARHGLAVVRGLESPEHYLARREPTYQVGRWVADHLPREARIVGQDHRGYYVPRPYTMELAYRRRTGLGRSGEPAETIVARLRQAGFTHLLLCPPIPETAVEFDPTLGRLLARWLAGREPLYRADLADADGVVRRYAIYPLGLSDSQAEGNRLSFSLPPCGGGPGRGETLPEVEAPTPHPDPPPQGGRGLENLVSQTQRERSVHR
jgi:hypothetical protein